jgi:hypothetical protein
MRSTSRAQEACTRSMPARCASVRDNVERTADAFALRTGRSCQSAGFTIC